MKIPKFFIIGFTVGVLFAMAFAGTMKKAPAPPATKAAATPSPAATLKPEFRGPADAPVTLVEFADFHCPFCAKAQIVMQRLLENFPGKIRWVFRHYPLSLDFEKGSFRTHHASLCAQEQGRFWDFHDLIFSSSAVPEAQDLKAIAEKIGLNQEDFEQCMQSGKYKDYLLRERQEGASQGVHGTPAFFINEHAVRGAMPYEYFEQAIKAILNPNEFELPFGLGSEEKAGNVTWNDLEGKPSLGPVDAPVTLVEFSDYHCPFCHKITPTLNQLMQKYDGKIRRVFRHFPLDMHRDAQTAHQAAECAHDQGKFWEYHNGLMSAPRGLRTKEELGELARQVSLDLPSFEACLESGKHRDTVQKDIAAGVAAGVSGTPAIFVNGQLISGAQPLDVFEGLIDRELKK